MPLNLFPEQIESPRLLIRVAKPGDGPAFNEAVVSSLTDLAPWLGWVTPPPTVEQSEANCRRGYARYLLNEDLMVFFFEKSSGALVGGSGLHGPDWATRKFEVGYWSRTGYGGQGLITEGVRALTDYALHELGAARVFLTCDDKNIRSWKLAERAGFILEGILVNERLNWAAAGSVDTDLRSLSVLELYRTDVAERRMPAPGVVEALDVFEHISPGFIARPVDLAGYPLGLH